MQPYCNIYHPLLGAYQSHRRLDLEVKSKGGKKKISPTKNGCEFLTYDFSRILKCPQDVGLFDDVEMEGNNSIGAVAQNLFR